MARKTTVRASAVGRGQATATVEEAKSAQVQHRPGPGGFGGRGVRGRKITKRDLKNRKF